MAKPTYDKLPVTISDQLDIFDTLESDLTSLFAKYPFADKRKNTYLGFPDDWHNDKGVWQ